MPNTINCGFGFRGKIQVLFTLVGGAIEPKRVAMEEKWLLLENVGRGLKVRVLGKVKSFPGDSRHVDVSVTIIRSGLLLPY